jgi:hypothetical protein
MACLIYTVILDSEWVKTEERHVRLFLYLDNRMYAAFKPWCFYQDTLRKSDLSVWWNLYDSVILLVLGIAWVFCFSYERAMSNSQVFQQKRMEAANVQCTTCPTMVLELGVGYCEGRSEKQLFAYEVHPQMSGSKISKDKKYRLLPHRPAVCLAGSCESPLCHSSIVFIEDRITPSPKTIDCLFHSFPRVFRD